MNGKVLRKALALMLAFAVIVTMFAGLPVTVSAQTISGAITESQVWNEGDTFSGAVAISGPTDAGVPPLIITVNGNVTVTEAITITGHVRITGINDGTLTRGRGGILIAVGTTAVNTGTLTLDSITLDGNGTNFTVTNNPLIELTNNTHYTLIINDGAVLTNNVNTTTAIIQGSTVRVRMGNLIMNGGAIRGNTNAGIAGAIAMQGPPASPSTFTLTGGTLENNLNTDARFKDDVAIFFNNPDNVTFNINPKSDIRISGGFDTVVARQGDDVPVTIEPQVDYDIASVTKNGASLSRTGDVYTFNFNYVNTGLTVTLGGGALPITNLAIGGVTSPATGVAPNTAAPTGGDGQWAASSIAWFNNSTNAPAGTTFSAETVYRAQIAITPETDWTLDGVTDEFTVAGASSVSRDDNVVTAIFPMTALVTPPTGLADISAILMAMFAFFAASVVLCGVAIRRKIRWNNG